MLAAAEVPATPALHAGASGRRQVLGELVGAARRPRCVSTTARRPRAHASAGVSSTVVHSSPSMFSFHDERRRIAGERVRLPRTSLTASTPLNALRPDLVLREGAGRMERVSPRRAHHVQLGLAPLGGDRGGSHAAADRRRQARYVAALRSRSSRFFRWARRSAPSSLVERARRPRSTPCAHRGRGRSLPGSPSVRAVEHEPERRPVDGEVVVGEQQLAPPVGHPVALLRTDPAPADRGHEPEPRGVRRGTRRSRSRAARRAGKGIGPRARLLCPSWTSARFRGGARAGRPRASRAHRVGRARIPSSAREHCLLHELSSPRRRRPATSSCGRSPASSSRAARAEQNRISGTRTCTSTRSTWRRPSAPLRPRRVPGSCTASTGPIGSYRGFDDEPTGGSRR